MPTTTAVVVVREGWPAVASGGLHTYQTVWITDILFLICLFDDGSVLGAGGGLPPEKFDAQIE